MDGGEAGGGEEVEGQVEGEVGLGGVDVLGFEEAREVRRGGVGRVQLGHGGLEEE